VSLPAPTPCAPLERPAYPPAPLGSVPCPSAGELDIVDSEVEVSFEGDFGTDPLVCTAAEGSRHLNQVQKNVYQALLYMKNVRFDTPLPWTDMLLYDWFIEQVIGVRVRKDVDGGFCCDPRRVINVTGHLETEATIPAYLQVLVHEARHPSWGGHPCGDRDNTIAEMGAFGVQYSLLVWIGDHCPAASHAERTYALQAAAWLRSVVFCQECGQEPAEQSRH